MRFRRSSTLIRWQTDTLTHENGGFRNRLPRWRLSTTDAFRISVDGRKRRKRRFSNTLTSRRTKTYRFLIASLDGRKRFENASVDADICIRFRWIKNGGIRKRIGVDVALVLYYMHVNEG